jgi:hypothetical protein
MSVGGMIGPPAHIPRPHPTIDESPVTLSFKYLDLESNQKFGINQCSTEFLAALLQELHAICQGQVCDLAEFNNRRHSHKLDFLQTTEPNGFVHLGEQIEPEEYWQFAVQENHTWRVHGFFIASVFYLVWLDPDHRLCTAS